MNTITVGTSHFLSYDAAVRYYLPYSAGNYRDTKAAVDARLKAGEIAIGQPEVAGDEILLVNQREGRYMIERPL